MKWRLKVGPLLSQVRLGCEADERRVPQSVKVSVEIGFAEEPPGCRSDRIEGTLCYAKICDKLQAVCAAREYRLIESLGYECFAAIQPLLPPSSELKVSLHKLHPPVPNLEGGATFEISS